MPKKNSKKTFLLVAGAILLLLAIGRLTQSRSETPPQNSEEALQDIVASGKIINVHEHVQDVENIPLLLHTMDKTGIHKSVLMGTSWFTITLNDSVGFTRYDENNEELIKIIEQYPDRFEAWPTINPSDSDKLDKLKDLVARGATGLKLYIGHGYTRRDNGKYMFHTMAVDDPDMYPIYAYCQENYLPICLHANPYKPGFAQEMIRMLTDFPDMKVNLPHFILSSIRDSRMREFLDTFPNVYSDVSFGHDDFLTAGLKRISKNPTKFREIFYSYPDRFMWGSDLVITHIDSKSEDWLDDRMQAYYDMLSAETYTTSVLPGEQLRGLGLSRTLLENVLYKNYENFLAARPKGTKITREINWDNMGVPKVERKPGQAFPPPPKNS